MIAKFLPFLKFLKRYSSPPPLSKVTCSSFQRKVTSDPVATQWLPSPAYNPPGGSFSFQLILHFLCEVM